MRSLYLILRNVLVFGLGVAAITPLTAQIAPPPPRPVQMELFAFLVGEWACTGSWRQSDGSIREFDVIWRGKRLLDGHAQVEEYRSVWPNGEIFVYGLNYRMFDTANNQWIVKWYDALNGASFDLGQPMIIKDGEDGEKIIFTTGNETSLNRAIYKNISPDSFTWQGDTSNDDGETWDVAVMTIDCLRAQG